MLVPLVTPNLTLRALSADDAPTLAMYRSDPQVARYQGWASAELAEAQAFIARLAVEPDLPGTWFQMAITLRGSGQMIGDLGLHFPLDRPRQTEVGITLSPQHQGRGYATEALRATLTYLFGALQKHRVYASIDPRNGASVALFERVGMRREAYLLESLWFKGEWVDDLVYAMLRREWVAIENQGARFVPSSRPRRMEKVTCFIVRSSAQRDELLLFEHPYAGYQIPAGTVEPEETPGQAALREANEETGLDSLMIERSLGTEETPLPDGMRAVIARTSVHARPNKASFAWAHLPRGSWVRSLRAVAEWEQVSYQEPDRLPDPAYTSYQITGWVPIETLAERQRRSFYLLRCDTTTPQEWTVHIDSHTFRLFWAPLDRLPKLIAPQDQWLRRLNRCVDGQAT